MLPRPFDTQKILKVLMARVIRDESIVFMHNVNHKWSKVHPDIPLFRFDPPEAHNSQRWDCVGNGIFHSEDAKT